jgi:phosphatidylinositol alpha-1,6-mannosyltransferase
VKTLRPSGDESGDRPLRLLFVCHTLPPLGRPLVNVGGMQRVAGELAEALARRPDLSVRTAALRSSWRWTWLRTPFFLLRAGSLALSLAGKGQVDAVLYSSLLSAALLWPLLGRLRRRGVTCAAVAHGQDVLHPWPVYQQPVRQALRRLAAVAAVSRATGDACLERGLAADRLRVIPNGVDAGRFPSQAGLGAARVAARIGREPTLPPDGFLICSVGRHVRRKGFLWFVERVMPLLPASVHFWLAGEGPDTQAISSAIARRDLTGRVRLLGRLPEPELVRLYCSADLFVMPNVQVAGTMEGFGIVLLEAGICGLPAVAARLEGIQDVVADGRNGILIPSGDAGAFAGAICRGLRDRAWLASLSDQAIEAAHRLSWDRVTAQYAELMHGLDGVWTPLTSGRSVARDETLRPLPHG